MLLGALVLDPVKVDLVAEGLARHRGRGARLHPGTYHLDTPDGGLIGGRRRGSPCCSTRGRDPPSSLERTRPSSSTAIDPPTSSDRAWCTWRGRSRSPMPSGCSNGPSTHAAGIVVRPPSSPRRDRGWKVEAYFAAALTPAPEPPSETGTLATPRSSSGGRGGGARCARRRPPALVAGRCLRRLRLGGPGGPGALALKPAFADTDGPLLVPRSFDADGPPEGGRRWLTFDGLFYQGDVWLDGAYLGDTEGYFAPTPSRSPTRCGPRRAPPRHRGHCAPDRPHRQAQPHRRLPALGLPRPRLEPRGHLAAGARQRDRTRPDRALRALCREATPSEPW